MGATDERSARLIAAVEAVAAAQPDIRALDNHDHNLDRSGPSPLMAVAKGLIHILEKSPGDVTPEVLRVTQSAVSKMQTIIGHSKVSGY